MPLLPLYIYSYLIYLKFLKFCPFGVIANSVFGDITDDGIYPFLLTFRNLLCVQYTGIILGRVYLHICWMIFGYPWNRLKIKDFQPFRQQINIQTHEQPKFDRTRKKTVSYQQCGREPVFNYKDQEIFKQPFAFTPLGTGNCGQRVLFFFQKMICLLKYL